MRKIQLGNRFHRAWNVPWTMRLLSKNRETAVIALVEIDVAGAKRVLFTNGHMMGEMSYVSRCVAHLDAKILKAHSDGVFPICLSNSDFSSWDKMSTGMREYYTDYAPKAIPIEDTNVLVDISSYYDDDKDLVTPVAVLRYKLGSSPGLDIPQFVVVDPVYHYQLRRHAHHIAYNQSWNSIFYYETDISPNPCAVLATMSPDVMKRVQAELDQLSMFTNEEKEEK